MYLQTFEVLTQKKLADKSCDGKLTSETLPSAYLPYQCQMKLQKHRECPMLEIAACCCPGLPLAAWVVVCCTRPWYSPLKKKKMKKKSDFSETFQLCKPRQILGFKSPGKLCQNIPGPKLSMTLLIPTCRCPSKWYQNVPARISL